MTIRLSCCVMIAGAVPQLNTADVAIVIDSNTASVEARYEFAQAVDSLVFHVIKLREQRFQLLPDPSSLAHTTVAELPGLYNITVARSTGDARRTLLRFEIGGDVSRIPLPVPNLPLEPGAGGVRIEIVGVGTQASLGDGFPRLTRESDGTAVAQLENMPGFVRLPPNQDEWSTNRLADVAVVLLVVASILYWLSRRRTRVGPA